MSELSLILPEIGKPDKTEDPRIVTAFTSVQTWANGNIDSSNITAKGISNASLAEGAVVKSGQQGGTGLFPPTNVHTLCPGLSLVTPVMLAGQVLVVWTSFTLGALGNELFGRLSLGGVERGQTVTTKISTVQTIIERITGLTGAQTLSAFLWSTTAAGEANASIFYEILNA